ncbi:MAG TPA: hypothetical protein VK986_22650 [Tepidisphaeraceae bacterium]|nr:hypothetical protein [Tepidisphaeraceae bacterium]
MRSITSWVAVVGVVVGSVAGEARAGEKRLDYRQEQSLKDAGSQLDRVEGMAKALAERVAKMKPGDASVQLQDVKQLAADHKEALRQFGFAEVRFKQLPVTHSKVKPQYERLAPITASLAATGEKMAAVQAGLDKVVAAGQGEGFKADFARLREITEMYINPRLLETDPEAGVAAARQVPAVRAEREQIASKYAGLLKQTTAEANEMNGVLRRFDQVFGAFEAEVKRYAAEGPKAVEESADRAEKLAEQGAAEKKVGFFGEHGGVNDALRRARAINNVLAAVAPDAAKAGLLKIEAATARVAMHRATMEAQIIQANRPPDETYAGADKEALVGLVKQKWAESGGKGDVMRVGINSAQWSRSVRWERNAGGWYKVDASKAQGFVIVRLDDKLAAIYHVNLHRDNLAGERVTASMFDDPKQPPGAGQKIPIANVK